MRLKTLTTILIICGLLQFAGCSSRNGIVGKWQQVGGTEKIEFLKDGSFIVEDGERPKGGGKYSIVDDTRLKIEPGGMMAVTGPMLTKYSRSQTYLFSYLMRVKPTYDGSQTYLFRNIN